MRNIVCIALTVVAAWLSACSTIFGDNTRSVEVNSVPQNATVYANDLPVGNTPLTLHISSTFSPTMLSFKKPGYQLQTAKVHTSFQPIGIANFLFPPGFVIDAISGDTMKVSTDSRIIIARLARANGS